MNSLSDSVAALLKDLESWGRYPKYSIERRLDLFLTPFIPQYLSEKLRCRERIELVAPEFPIRHAASFQTVNVDYLMLRRDEPTWLLVELKTDVSSVDDEQAALYARVAKEAASSASAPMRRLVDELPEIRKHSKRRITQDKYSRLIERCDDFREYLDAPVKVVYVAPSSPRPEPWRIIRLRALASWCQASTERYGTW